MAALIRAHDWSSTSLGPVELWPQSLKTAIRIMLLSRQPVWVGWGEDLVYFYNDAYHSIIGGKHPWALGRPTLEVWSEIKDVIGPMLRTAMMGDEGTYVEDQLLIMERNGYPEETYYTFSYSPIPDDEGEPGGIICANTDDTQRVIGQRELALLRDLAARTAKSKTAREACERSIASLASDRSDLPFAAIYRAEESEAALTLQGASGLVPGHRLAPERLAEDDSLDAYRDVLEGREPYRIVLVEGDDVPLTPLGVRPREALVLPLAAVGEATSSLLVVGLNPYRLFDEGYRGFLTLVAGQIGAAISDAEAIERERRNAEVLAELDRTKTAFFANVSHELRTPLTLILGPLEDTLAGANGPLPSGAAEELTVVHRNGLRLLKLVNTLLDFSRIESGRTQARFEPVDLPHLTAALASTFRSAVDRAGLNLVVDCPPISRPVDVDRDMWEKIVLNLLSNAFKFTLAGEIRVAVREVDGQAQLSVADTGTGIPAESVPRLFERFYRVEGAQGRTHEGTGIGLALVSELAALHGGRAWAESEIGRGSTFFVSVPLRAASPVNVDEPTPIDEEPGGATRASIRKQAFAGEAIGWIGASAPSVEADGEIDGSFLGNAAGARVLLADDNADMRDYVERLLSKHFRVVSVPDGAAALAEARKTPPDLVLSDVMMPNLDGFGLLKAVREDPALAGTPVILLSARAGEEAKIDGLDAGADDYLVKPFAARELLARVGTHVQLARIRRESERALRRSESALAEAQRLARIGSWEWDLATDLSTVSAELCRLFGLDEEAGVPAFRGQNGTMYPPESWERLNAAAQESLRTGEGYVLEIEARRGEERIWVEARSEVVRDETGEIVGLRGTVQDVTEERRLREIAAQDAERLRALAEASPSIIWVSEPDGTLAFIGKRWTETTGLRREDHATELSKIVPPADYQRLQDAWSSARERKTMFEAEFRIPVLGTDELRWHVTRAVPQKNEEGEIVRWFGSTTDIHERKSAEQTLERLVRERTAELTASNRELESFCYSVSHDLRSPARAVMGSAMILLEDYGDRLPPEAKEKLFRQVTASRRMGQLIDDLLQLSRIGRSEIIRDPFDFSALAEQVAGEVSARRGADAPRIVVAPGLRAYGDPRLVRLVLQNLLENANKFVRPGRAGTIRIGSEASEHGTAFFVADEGIGFDEAFADKIFEPFQRLHRDEEYEGTGIGLANVKRIVERHGGAVWARGREGEGAVFSFTLPSEDGE